jgi:hypothetical protein
MTSSKRGRESETIIVVSGLPRSGTSMAMQMLAAAGVPIVSDGLREPGEDNPRGYLEDSRVKALHKEGETGEWLAEAKGKAIKIVSFFLKYLPAENDYRVIFMRRDLTEILSSQRKMLERRGEKGDTGDEQLYDLWRTHLQDVDHLLEGSSHIAALDVAYRDVIESSREQAQRIRDFLGMDLDVDAMVRAVDQSLYRNRA